MPEVWARYCVCTTWKQPQKKFTGPYIKKRVYKKSQIWSDHRWRKFGHGIVLVQHGNSLRSLVGVAQRLQKLIKVDIYSLKMSKINLPPSNLKISNFLLDLDIKHLFWARWIEKTCMEVTM